MTIHPQTDPITIFYPNGGNTASQMYVWDGTKPVLWTGSVTFSGTLNVGVVSGSLTNNNAAPAANNLGALVAVVSTTNLGYTQGNQALLRVDTTGALVISGSISVSTTGLATSANQTNAAQKTQIVDGAGNVIGATSNALDVNIKSGITNPLPITGTVTANLGTINGAATAANQATEIASLASIDSKLTAPLSVSVGSSVLPTGAATLAEQQVQSLSLSVIDDWDESDRAKVNPIAGQVGVAANSGTVSASTQRVVLATDQTSIPVTSTTLATNAGAANLFTAQVTVTTTATVIAASRTTRRAITFENLGSTNVYLGTTAVTTTTGMLLFGTTGAAISIMVTGTISGIVASGSQAVSYLEEYD